MFVAPVALMSLDELGHGVDGEPIVATTRAPNAAQLDRRSALFADASQIGSVERACADVRGRRLAGLSRTRMGAYRTKCPRTARRPPMLGGEENRRLAPAHQM